METKKQKIFVHLFCNALIALVLSLAVVLSIYFSRQNLNVYAQNSEYNGTIYAGDKNSKNVSLMINVYWGTEYVQKMLEILKKYNVKTTFFIGGTWAEENKELLKKIYDEGHEIASHGYSHKEHGKISFEANLEEMQKCHKIIKDELGVEMELFAPPGGSYSSDTIKASEQMNYKTIMWTRDTIDWRDHNTSLIVSRALTNISGGDLILMHPTQNTVEALTNIIESIQKRGLEVSTVSKTLGL